jgi:hypothetical protein
MRREICHAGAHGSDPLAFQLFLVRAQIASKHRKVGIKKKGAVMQRSAVRTVLRVTGKLLPVKQKIVASRQLGAHAK